MTTSELVFGSGSPNLGLWNSSCELYESPFIESKIEILSVCTGAEGEQSVAERSFSGPTIRSRSLSARSFFELERCLTGQGHSW